MMTRNVLDTVMLSVSHPQKKAPLPWGACDQELFVKANLDKKGPLSPTKLKQRVSLFC
jgi:hypothetical protein